MREAALQIYLAHRRAIDSDSNVHPDLQVYTLVSELGETTELRVERLQYASELKIDSILFCQSFS